MLAISNCWFSPTKILADFQLGVYLPAGRQACKVKC